MVKAQTKPKAAASAKPLTSQAMLVNLAVHRWGNRKTERMLADKTAEDQKAKKGMFRTTKKLIARESITVVTSAISALKVFHYRNTAPWLDNGDRILPAKHFLEYMEGYRKLLQGIEEAKAQFAKVYPKLVEQAQKEDLGEAFNPNDYPPIDRLLKRWSVEVHFTPMPDSADFRVDLPAEEIKRVNADIDVQVQVAIEAAQNDLFGRVYAVVTKTRDKLAKYRVIEGGKKGKRKVENAFRDSAIDNVANLCELLPKLNFTNNPELVKLVEDVRKTIASQDPEALRDDEVLREKTVQKATAVLKSMEDKKQVTEDLLAKMADYLGEDDD